MVNVKTWPHFEKTLFKEKFMIVVKVPPEVPLMQKITIIEREIVK